MDGGAASQCAQVVVNEMRVNVEDLSEGWLVRLFSSCCLLVGWWGIAGLDRPRMELFLCMKVKGGAAAAAAGWQE